MVAHGGAAIVLTLALAQPGGVWPRRRWNFPDAHARANGSIWTRLVAGRQVDRISDRAACAGALRLRRLTD
jgi:hypothetical protein